jgi:hypothetical protein
VIEFGCGLHKMGKRLRIGHAFLFKLQMQFSLKPRRQTSSGQETYQNRCMASFSANNSIGVKESGRFSAQFPLTLPPVAPVLACEAILNFCGFVDSTND